MAGVSVTTTGTIAKGSERVIVRTSTGLVYVFVNVGGNIQAWKGNNTGVPTSFSEIDAGDAPDNSLYVGLAAAIDSNDRVFVAAYFIEDIGHGSDPEIRQWDFHTADDASTPDNWDTTFRVISNLVFSSGDFGTFFQTLNLSVDANDNVHCIWQDQIKDMSADDLVVMYSNTIASHPTWKTSVEANRNGPFPHFDHMSMVIGQPTNAIGVETPIFTHNETVVQGSWMRINIDHGNVLNSTSFTTASDVLGSLIPKQDEFEDKMSLGVDHENVYLVYIEQDTLDLEMLTHEGTESDWTANWTNETISSANDYSNPSMALIDYYGVNSSAGHAMFIFTEAISGADTGDIIVLYSRNSTTGDTSWTRRVLEAGTYEQSVAKWSKYNDNRATIHDAVQDVVYEDGAGLRYNQFRGLGVLQHSTDSRLVFGRTLTHNTDSVLKKLDNEITHTTDSLLVAGGPTVVTEEHTTDSVLKALDNEITHDTDSVLRAIDNEITHTTDSILKAIDTKTHDTDSVLKQLDNLITHDTDSVLREIDNEISHTTDSFLLRRVQLTHDTDSVLKKIDIRTHDTDSVLKELDNELTHTTDSVLVKRIEITHDTDSVLKALDNEISHTTDSVLKKIDIRTHDTDSVLKALDTEITHDTDSVLKELDNEINHTTDSFLKAIETRTHDTDSVLRQLDNEITHTTDSLLNRVVTLEHTTDSVLKELDNLRTHDTDSVLKEIDNEITHTTDSLLTARKTITHDTDSVLRAIDNEITHDTDSVLKQLDNELTHTTDSFLNRVVELIHTTDSVLKELDNEITHTTDSVLKQIDTRTHDTDSVLKAIGTTVDHTTDSVLKKLNNEITHDTDSVLREIDNEITHTTDSVLKKIETRDHDTDSVLKKLDNLVTHTTDSLVGIVTVVTVSHTTDSLLVSGVEPVISQGGWVDVPRPPRKIEVKHIEVDFEIFGSLKIHRRVDFSIKGKLFRKIIIQLPKIQEKISKKVIEKSIKNVKVSFGITGAIKYHIKTKEFSVKGAKDYKKIMKTMLIGIMESDVLEDDL